MVLYSYMFTDNSTTTNTERSFEIVLFPNNPEEWSNQGNAGSINTYVCSNITKWKR